MTDARHIPKRVLHIHFGKEGGAERFFVSLCQSMARAGVEQRFLIRPGRSWAGQVRALGAVKEATYPRIAPIRALLQRWVDGQVRDWKPDAVIAWMPKAATLLPKAEGPAKLVRLGDYPRHIKHFAHADCMIGNTPGVKARLEELNWPGPVEVISNFPRGGEANPDAVSFDLPKGSFVLSAAGRFVGLKGFDTLIRAMAQVDRHRALPHRGRGGTRRVGGPRAGAEGEPSPPDHGLGRPAARLGREIGRGLRHLHP
jgi:glycosyltransferase involved in cell wall biosynthesis